jgi:hypothetical protein
MVAVKFNQMNESITLIDVKMSHTFPAKEKKGKNLHDVNSVRCILADLDAFLLKHNPHLVCAELPLGSQSSQAMIGLGICTAILSTIKYPLILVNPFDVKKVVYAGAKRKVAKGEIVEWATTKQPSELWFKRKLKGKIVYMASNEHLADALVSIYAGMEKEVFSKIVK